VRATIRLTLLGVRRRGAGQVAVLVVVTALASAAVVAGMASRRSTATIVDHAYKTLGRPDLVLYGDPDTLRAAARDPEIELASPPEMLAAVKTRVDGKSVDVSITALGRNHAAVGGPKLVDGRWPRGTNEVVVERSIVVEGASHVGATMLLRGGLNAPVTSVHVVGSVIELSDCLYLRQQCDPLRVFGRGDLVASLAAPPAASSFHASYRVKNPARAPAVGARLVGASHGQISQNNWRDTRRDILVMAEVFGAIVSAFGGFMLAAACFVIAGATAARLAARRRSLGLLRAIGFSPGQVTAALLAEHLVLGAVGVVFGWVLGSLAAPGLNDVDRVFVGASRVPSVESLVVALLVVEAFLAAAVVIPAWRAGREPASEVLRDVPPPLDGGRTIASIARRLGASASLVAGLRRAVARPGRASLAAAALFVATIAAIMSYGFIHSVAAAKADTARVGDPFDAVVITPALGNATTSLDTMREVSAWQTERAADAALGNATYRANLLGGDPTTFGYRIESGRALAANGEAIVGYGFLTDSGLHIGDSIHATVGGVPVDLRIVGSYAEATDSGKVIQLLASSVPTNGLIAGQPQLDVRAAPGVSRAALVAALRAHLQQPAVVTANELQDTGVGAVQGTLLGFTALLLLVAAANLVATTVAATRERARALGVLRAIGCTTGQLVVQSAAGTALLGFFAAMVGVPLGLVIFTRIADTIASGAGVGPGLITNPPLWFLAALVPAAVLVAGASGALGAAALARTPAAELVRYE
jgi:putative ABC transport system permease protein